LDRLESLAHLARPPSLLRAQAGLFKLRDFSPLPERQGFPANRPGTEARGLLTLILVTFARSTQFGLDFLSVFLALSKRIF
jgi:hypothetical protein